MKYLRLLVVALVLLGAVYVLWQVTATVEVEAPKTPVKAPPRPALASLRPQVDLRACEDQALVLVTARDVAGVLKVLVPPDSLRQALGEGEISSLDAVAKGYRQMPGFEEKMQRLQKALELAKNRTPEYNLDNTLATFKANGQAPDGANSDLIFVKVNGYWYMNGF